MIKVILLLCAMAAALVCAKPSGKQEESNVATPLNLTHERPNRPVNGSERGVTGSFTVFYHSDASEGDCVGPKQVFSCDGHCYVSPQDIEYGFKVYFFKSS
jgi:hypothetical protein